MAPPKGSPRPKGAGRQKGSANKLTVDLRQMVINALHRAGGEDYLLEQAIENPHLFLPLVSKIMPAILNVQSEKKTIVTINLDEIRQQAVVMRQKYAERLKVIEHQPIVN